MKNKWVSELVNSSLSWGDCKGSWERPIGVLSNVPVSRNWN